MINLENLQAIEAEKLAYSEGFPGTARLFARIDDLQRALGQATAQLADLQDVAADLKIKTIECEILESELQTLEKQNSDIRSAVNRAQDIMLISPMGAMQILEKCEAFN
jgi:tetrahydromethanopterin S-methyltransferase subunit H